MIFINIPWVQTHGYIHLIATRSGGSAANPKNNLSESVGWSKAKPHEMVAITL